MPPLKPAEDGLRETEPTLRELAEELSLELSPEPLAAVRGSPVVKSVGAGQRGAANLFAFSEPHNGKRYSLVSILLVAAFLLFSAGGAYSYLVLNGPVSSNPSSAAQSSVNPLSPLLGSVAAAGEQPESMGAPSEPFDPPSSALNAASDGRVVAAPETLQESTDAVADIGMYRGGQSEINPDLVQAYQSLHEGRLEEAKLQYRRLLQMDARHVDALLGMAAVALRLNSPGEAGKLYFRALEADPENAFAQAGLLNLLAGIDPVGSEAKLKQLLAEKPAGFLYFVLGNLHAVQGRWQEAQHAYFQACRLESDNPDYAFNLAVSLEQTGQPGPALAAYQNAQAALRQKGANFARETADARIAYLQNATE